MKGITQAVKLVQKWAGLYYTLRFYSYESALATISWSSGIMLDYACFVNGEKCNKNHG